MSTWQSTDAITMLRVLINDLAVTPVYDTDTLKKMLCVSAIYIQQDIDFDTDYTVSLSTLDITPDPGMDSIFTNFMVMKAACQADISTFRTKALMDGITAKCGPALLTTLQHTKAFKDLIDFGPCAAYEEMKKDYVLADGSVCRAILSPFVGNNFNPEDLSSVNNGNYDSYFS